MIRGLLLLTCLVGVCCSSLLGQESSAVRAEIGVDEAWMGQGVRFTVTLFSPGPFSGTAVFQIPEIPNTLMVKDGNPVVGSETVDGESMISQRHEFSVYTQQDGKFEIPSFPVTYKSKETFLGDPVSRSGVTTSVSFTSKRPPGTEGFAFVVSSATATASQSWSPANATEFEAGNILSRSISREATDVNVMTFVPIQPLEIDGVRIYPGEPEVTEKRVRGDTRAKRVDTIRYQFSRGGTFTIPEITLAWWNPKTETLDQTELAGLTFTVTAAPTRTEPIHNKEFSGTILLTIALLIVVVRLLFPAVQKRLLAWQEKRHSREAEAARALTRACRGNDAKEAFVALMSWRRVVGTDSAIGDTLRETFDALSRHLFAEGVADVGWDGAPLLAAFREELHHRSHHHTQHRRFKTLPQLNPGPT